MVSPTVELARYKYGKLCVEAHELRAVSYIAISHVWGDTEDRHLPGFALRPIPVSKHKRDFLMNKLPKLVGDSWFWMDVICIDQRSDDARIAVVDHIPEIFRNAWKTIVIKDGDGLTACCRSAIGIFEAVHGWEQRFIDHLHEKHLSNLITDSWLERLWPLQEAMLSNKLHFVSCEDRYVGIFRFYGEQMSFRRLKDNLWTISQAWVAYGQEKDNVSGRFEKETLAFMNAFLHNGTITRRPLPASATGVRGFGWELRQHSNSRRKTTEARDFVLAIMPQYGWYNKPKGVKNMTFSQIFSNSYKQALEAGVVRGSGPGNEVMFVPRLTRGMIEPTLSSKATIEPAYDIPLPETLGDFVKLLGSTVPERASTLGLSLGKVQITPISDVMTITEAVEIVRESMHFSQQKWYMAYIGELSEYDSLPESFVPPIDIRPFIRSKSGQPEESIDAWKARKTREEIGLRMSSEHITHECCRILNSMWTAWYQGDRACKGDWTEYEEWLLGQEPPGYELILVYLAALVSCGLGISALSWVRQRMTPVIVKLAEFSLLGLVQSGAATLERAYHSVEYFRGYHAVQRVSDFATKFDVHGFTGRDCVLTVDLELEKGAVSREVVGLLPDLVDADSTEHFKERFEAVFPNDGNNAEMTFVRLG